MEPKYKVALYKDLKPNTFFIWKSSNKTPIESLDFYTAGIKLSNSKCLSFPELSMLHTNGNYEVFVLEVKETIFAPLITNVI